MFSHYIEFSLKSILGISLYLLLKWETPVAWGRLCLLFLNCFLIVLFLYGSFLGSLFYEAPVPDVLAVLYLLAVLWPVGTGYLLDWEPLKFEFKTLKVFCLVVIGLFVGLNIWENVPSIFQDIYMFREVKMEKTSPKEGSIATVFFQHGPSMFNDGTTVVNLRRKGKPFRYANYFYRYPFWKNPDNVAILTGFNAGYCPMELNWIDETHLKVIVSEYDHFSKTTNNGSYDVYFSKKDSQWGNVVVEYGNKEKPLNKTIDLKKKTAPVTAKKMRI